MLKKGYFQIYTGEGKGKTTASIGLAVRALGGGFKVYLGQFMKGQDYGELHSLKSFPNLLHEQLGHAGWVYKDKLKPEQVEAAEKGLARSMEVLTSGERDLVILDELNMAVWFGLISEAQVIDLVSKKPEHVELVITGRYASDGLISLADLVTEMKPIKHYYDMGVPSRKGIEN